MINFTSRKTVLASTLLLSAMFVVLFSGCFGAMAQLLYVIKGYDIPAAYDGLVGKRTAIVCVSDASAYGPDRLTYTVSKALAMKLAQGVKKIEVVPHSAIEKWIDENGWDEMDFTALGAGVNADRVVAVEIASYSIHEGETLFKGRANVTVTVYDLEVKKGESKQADTQKRSHVAHIYTLPDYEFPKNGRPAIQTSDRQFEAFFLARLTQKITDQFVKHDKLESYADEAMMGY